MSLCNERFSNVLGMFRIYEEKVAEEVHKWNYVNSNGIGTVDNTPVPLAERYL